jgi:hypothetical protein
MSSVALLWGRIQKLKTHGLLSALALLSYFTTALRDTFLVAKASDSDVIDRAVLAVAVGSTIAAVLGLAALLLYTGGKQLRGMVFGLLGLSFVGMAALTTVPIVGLALLVCCSLTLFHIGQAFAAKEQKFLAVSVVSMFSSLATISVWITIGVDSIPKLAMGFAAGTLVQAWTALGLGHRHWLNDQVLKPMATERTDVRAALSLALPAQAVWLLSRVPYAGSDAGQLATASLVLTLVFSTTVALASPTVYLDLAGRKSVGNRTMKHLSYLAGAILFAVSGLAAVLSTRIPLSLENQSTIATAGKHGLVLTLASPAVTYLYLRVRQSDPIQGIGLKKNVLYISLLIQLASIGATRLIKIEPALLGFGFVFSQWVAVAIDKHHSKPEVSKVDNF